MGSPQRRMAFVWRGEGKIQAEFSACRKWNIVSCSSTMWQSVPNPSSQHSTSEIANVPGERLIAFAGDCFFRVCRILPSRSLPHPASSRTGIDRTYHIIKYSAMVSSALFRSSSQSPAISNSSRITIRSPVSKSLGSSCRRKPPSVWHFGRDG